jgi:hypothetical protein
MARCERLRRRMALSRQMINRPLKVAPPPVEHPKNLEDESLLDYALRYLESLARATTDPETLRHIQQQRQSLLDDAAREGTRRRG